MKYDLPLPAQALVDKTIPKIRIYDKADLSRAKQREFIDKIDKIVWKYKLAESTIGIAKTANVEEIQVIDIHLKQLLVPKTALAIIDKSIPYHILYRFIHHDDFCYAITLKSNGAIDNYYFSSWNDIINFEFTGLDLERVYQGLVKSFVRKQALAQGSFQDIVGFDNKLKCLENEIDSLKSKINKEKQFNRKVELNRILLEKQKELNRLNGDR